MDGLQHIENAVDRFLAKVARVNEPLEAFRETESFKQFVKKMEVGIYEQAKWVSKNLDQIAKLDAKIPEDPTELQNFTNDLKAEIGTWLFRNMPLAYNYISEERIYVYLHNAFVFSVKATYERHGGIAKSPMVTFYKAEVDLGSVQNQSGDRPAHQQELEDAHNAGDYKKVKEILDSIPDNDPYKSSMAALFADDVAKALAELTPTQVEFKLTNKYYIGALRNQANYLLHLSSIDETTRQRLITLIANAKLQNNSTIDEIAGIITDNFKEISSVRAFMIANTETNQAMSTAQLAFLKENNVPTKKWVGAGSRTCVLCQGNENQGPIPTDQAFASGHMMTPGHTSCECYTDSGGEIDLNNISIWTGY